VVISVPLSEVTTALGIGRRSHVALVGGGGKTTILHALGAQLEGGRVLTTTTRMGRDQHGGLPVLIDPTDDELHAATGEGAVLVWARIEGDKGVGVEPEHCDRWSRTFDHVLVEADGSQHRPFKAPADHEPVVPRTATLVVSMIGADALGRVIADQCHRPLRVAALAGCGPYERLTPSGAATVLLHERGARRAVPPTARFAVVITKVDDATADAVGDLSAELLHRDPDVAVIAVGS